MTAPNYNQTFGTVGTLVVSGSRRAASSVEPGFPNGSLSVVTVTPASGPAVDVYSAPASLDTDPSLAVGRAVVRALQVAAGN